MRILARKISISTSRNGRNGLQGLCFWPVVHAQGHAQSPPHPRADGPKPRVSLFPRPHPHNRPPAKAPFGLASGVFVVFREVLSINLTAAMVAILLLLQLVLPLAVRAEGIALKPVMVPCCGELPKRSHELASVPMGNKAVRHAEGKGRPRSRLVLSAALTLGAGALAYWSKDRADRAYGRYLRSANTQRQQEQFDRAERFDRVAGTAFLSMEVGLIFTSYLLFFRR